MESLTPTLERHLIEIQRAVASRISLIDGYSEETVAGVDQAFIEDLVISGAVVLRQFEIIDAACHAEEASIPYVPGFLSFREGPPAIMALGRLKIKPTLIFVDGCGINHPRMAGLASYIGVMLDIPTIGISKDILCGCFEAPVDEDEANPLVYGKGVVGYVLKSRKGCRPIVVAPGHKVSVDSSLVLARKYLKGYKLPEPSRLAHEYANRMKSIMH
ncbi:MAG: endonuclease V [Methanotrichaceae archaeon]